jgi:hypothetical protein
VNVSDDGNFHLRLSNDLKSMQCILCVAPRDGLVTDQPGKPRVTNRRAEGFQFVAPAFGDQFHATIRQVPHRAGHFKSRGQGFRGVAKTNTLHVARVNYAHTTALHAKLLTGACPDMLDKAKACGKAQYFIAGITTQNFPSFVFDRP